MSAARFRTHARLLLSATWVCAIGSASGCATEPVEAICPDVIEGELVITELRGEQTNDDDLGGQWIELYNASGSTLDLRGLVLAMVSIDGSDRDRVIVRSSTTVAAGAYVVLGVMPSSRQVPPSYDYTIDGDVGGDLIATGAIEVEACGTRIDRLVYPTLARTGAYALGLMPPSADGNDTDTAWCVDATLDAAEFASGTPGEANRPCT